MSSGCHDCLHHSFRLQQTLSGQLSSRSRGICCREKCLGMLAQRSWAHLRRKLRCSHLALHGMHLTPGLWSHTGVFLATVSDLVKRRSVKLQGLAFLLQAWSNCKNWLIDTRWVCRLAEREMSWKYGSRFRTIGLQRLYFHRMPRSWLWS